MLQGDHTVELVVLCADKPTHTLLKRVAKELPIQLNTVSEDHKYTVSLAPAEGAALVTDGTITVKVSLTSPLLREPPGQGIFQLFFIKKFFIFCLGPDSQFGKKLATSVSSYRKMKSSVTLELLPKSISTLGCFSRF